MSIQLQNATRVINDATAVTDDVISGKVFYNNDGKCVGTMNSDLVLRKSSITIPASTYTVDVSSHCVHTLRACKAENLKNPQYLIGGDKRIYAYGSLGDKYIELIHSPTLHIDKSPSTIDYMMYNTLKIILCERYYDGSDFQSIYDGWQQPLEQPEYVLIPVSKTLGLSISVNSSSKRLGSIGLYRIAGRTPNSSNCDVQQTSISVVYHD